MNDKSHTPATISVLGAKNVRVGESLDIGAKVKDAGGNVLAGASVTFGSSNTSVATVDARGAVKAVKIGTATITTKSGDVSATSAITVA